MAPFFVGDTEKSKEEIAKIIPFLVDKLWEYPEGTEIATGQLVHACGIPDVSLSDLMNIHIALFDAASDMGLKLDMSKHEKSVEGLPFNLDYKIIHL